jgi:DNA-binding beta-propeller fold protein YncE
MRYVPFVLLLAVAAPAVAAPTKSGPVAVAPDGHVFVVNPDQDTVARLEFDAMAHGTRTHEAAVGTNPSVKQYPRTLALAGSFVFTANQASDSVSRLAQADLGGLEVTAPGDLPVGCAPYGVSATPAGDRIVVSCQGTSDVFILTTELAVVGHLRLPWPTARAIAVSDAGKAYVTHFLTQVPNDVAHVSVVDVAGASLVGVFGIQPDTATCETQNSGQGPLNLVSAIALTPPSAPAEVANQLWVGGEQENNLNKGLFERSVTLGKDPEAAMFPFTFTPFPVNRGQSRDVFKASFHDIIRSGIYKLNADDGTQIGKIDIDEGTQASDIAFSSDGTAAYVVDLGFNSYHVLNTVRGQRANDVTTLFAPPSKFGPGGAQGPSTSCVPEALTSVTSEVPFRMAPQAQITVIDGIDPVRFDGVSYQSVATGLDFDVATFHASGTSQMVPRADGIGTGPMGVAVSPDGGTVYVANYLSRNVVPAAAAFPPGSDGKPANFRCCSSIGSAIDPAPRYACTNTACGTTSDCAAASGFCNHPGGATCRRDSDCAADQQPCVLNSQCQPLLLGDAVSSIGGADHLPAALLDGKILFSTAARDSSVPNNVGLGSAAPLYNDAKLECANAPGTKCRVKGAQCAACANDASHLCTSDADCPGSTCVRPVPDQPATCTNAPLTFCTRDADCGSGQCLTACRVSKALPGEIVSTSHDASYVTCETCHADFGGQDGRVWDFSQLGVSIRNTMDLRGRSGFAPGHCDNAPATQCFFDAACGDGHFCKADDANIPPNVQGADRQRWFNPMMTIHWNGDRDEVEDFEHTFRSLQGAGDCDAAEHAVNTCMGGLVQRSVFTSMDPVDVNADEGAPNRNLRGVVDPNMIVGIRLTHMADFVYSLTDFVRNPNPRDEAAERGRKIFNDPQTKCVTCHSGGPAGKEFFTDKRPLRQGFDTSKPGGQDANNPFFRHDVGTANFFDKTDPNAIASANQSFQNTVLPIPGPRGSLSEYITPTLVDVWNTAPFLHDGTAATLLDVVRACDNTVDNCFRAGRGRNVSVGQGGQHGVTEMLTPQQMNDLVAFMKSAGTDTAVAEQAVLQAGTLSMSRAVVVFPKVPKSKKKARKRTGSFTVQGIIAAVPGAADPSHDPVTFTIATPGGEQMVLLSTALEMRGSKKRASGRSADHHVRVKLVQSSAGYRFTATGKHVDLVDLDTGNPDLTAAFEIGGATFAHNRNLAGKKNVLKLPRRRA